MIRDGLLALHAHGSVRFALAGVTHGDLAGGGGGSQPLWRWSQLKLEAMLAG